ncbi:GDSL esterase/lipase At4g10955-like [Silene latifolia]|uniref:GDSL esterase/lipase At4g10955-like n=1 Tax=Silene latifolia TaxID=37657 RepID=UPI003D782EDD
MTDGETSFISIGDPSEKEIFGLRGPFHLNNVDWSKPDDKRAIAASLVEGVYILERDRQHERRRNQALAPIWWKFFHFKCIEEIKDIHDGSIIGAIFKYNHHEHIGVPPKYVIAFRGTLLKWPTIGRDIYSDFKVALNLITESTRYETFLVAVQRVIDQVSPEDVWLAGHSLGASIALQVGKAMARKKCPIKTYLFNRPYVSLPLEKINNEGFRFAAHRAGYVATKILTDAHSTDSSDPHGELRSWFPYMFVNRNDPICREYIGYFEQREKMESMGLENLANIGSRKPLIGLLFDAKSDREALHLVPSAYLVQNLLPMDEDDLKGAHTLQQWWAPHTQWQTRRFQFH